MTRFEKYKLIIMTVFGVIILYIFHNFSQNGRYLIKEEPFLTILDTQKGTLYVPLGKEYLELSDFKKQKNKKK